ncbi:BREX-1 system phosphatase PglZ type B [Pseudoclavibacter sp. RFBB5]|uniref:BREX-1 system phosphatase PglZ type B n=1 Tax=Pseudoclavibacter sp. RFBB5 TaxID=2080574 RepID=UPI000CE8C2D0|nr:BREX-1 system phosphatase PglZ type B [Pseudoclavibacter sp. RFBB5]PPG29162.1 BREX-1 system phosphatase PglZ type B [Pseudoclavibacter sp. RFBB5]
MTLVRAVVAKALRDAGAFNSGANFSPAAVLWADPERTWVPVIRSLQEAVPILVLGEYDPATAQGPALWLRAVLASPESAELPSHLAGRDERNPWVIYLPGVSRSSVAEASALNDSLAPLAEVAIRSNWWPSAHGQTPWTPHSFLSSKQGAGLDIAGDAATKAALTQVLDKFFFEDIDDLKRMGRLDSSRLHRLVLEDSVRTLLEWMNDPDGVRASLKGGRWQALRAACKSAYGFDPETDGALTAARKLGGRTGEWGAAWRRFVENPSRYPNLPALLDQARPSAVALFGDMDPHIDSWPSWNQGQEDALRSALDALGASCADPHRRVAELADAHTLREDSVWAALGQAPLARAVGHLAEIADRVVTAPAATDLETQVAWFGNEGHLIDDLALRTIATAKTARDRTAVAHALGVIYDPWVDQSARAFQEAAVGTYHGQTGLDVSAGTCVVYVDALRYDLATRLARRLSPLAATVEPRLAAFPSVTPTGQPAVAPIKISVAGGVAFDAADTQGRSVKGPILRLALAGAGVQVLDWDTAEVGDPAGIAWTQTNMIDSLGHSHGHQMADLVDQQLDLVAERVRALLDTGWRKVVVVTDHGFLLPAQTAEKVSLPLPVTEGDTARKPRVARLKAAAARPNFPILPWTWDSSVDMVSAPGAAAFEAGRLYEHGGLSPQECVIPIVTVTRSNTAITPVKVEAVRWAGQRCRIDYGPAEADLMAEIRLRPADASSTVGGPKAPAEPGEVKVLVDEERAPSGVAAWVVLLDLSGGVLAQTQTTVGGAE